MKDRIQPRPNCCLQPLLSHLAQVPVLQRMVPEVSTVKTTSSPPKNKILSWPLKHLLARATQACVSLLPESQQVGTSFSLGCTGGNIRHFQAVAAEPSHGSSSHSTLWTQWSPGKGFPRWPKGWSDWCAMREAARGCIKINPDRCDATALAEMSV